MQVLKTIYSAKTGKMIGEIFQDGSVFAFCHCVTDEFQTEFLSFDQAYDAFLGFYYDWKENLQLSQI